MRKTLITLIYGIILSAAAMLWGQTGSGTLSGKITNAQGATVPKATVTVTNTSNNASQKVLTAPDGTFTITALVPGAYRIEVEIAGYKRTSAQDVQLNTGSNNVNLTLQPASTTETVEIKGQAPVTQTESGEVATSLGTRTIQELPVIDRNYQALTGLQTGITPPVPALDPVRDPDRNRFFSADGQSTAANEWEADGVYNTEPFRGTAVRVSPDEATRTVDVSTANLLPEKGFAGGAFVNHNIADGTNAIHGDLFEFYGGDLLRADSPFGSGLPSPRFVYNQFGATVGGPIVRDKTFFFASYEGTYDSGENTQLTTVPTAAAASGNFSGIPGLTLYNPQSGLVSGTGRSPFTGGIIPTSQINPTAASIVSQLPAPNLSGFYDNYATNVPQKRDGQKADARIDQHFTDRSSAFLRYGYTNWWNYQASPLGDVIGGGTRDRLLGQNATADFSHDFGGSLITDFRFGYNRYDQKLNPWGSSGSLAGLPGFTNFAGSLEGINIPGMAAIGAPAYVPEHGVDNTFNWTWSWGWHKGMNDFKWGTDIRRIRNDGFTDTMTGSQFGPNGTAYFGPGATLLNSSNATELSPYSEFYNSFAAFLLGAPTQAGVSNYLLNPSIRQSEYSAWLEDKINVGRRLVLDLGVRYEVYSPLEPSHTGGAAFYNPATNTFNYAGIGSTGMYNSRYDLNNVAPRFGFAYRATDKTVIRGGYGWNYFQQPYMYSGFMAPTYGLVSGTQGGYTVAPLQGTFGPTVPGVTAPGSLVNGASAGNLPATLFPRGTNTPYIQTFSLQVQQEFYWSTMLTVGYVGSLGRHLNDVMELNAALPGTGVAGLPFESLGRTASTLYYDNGLTDNYNSMQVSLMKRFTGGLSFLASYTWSHALGYTGSNNLLLNPTNLSANYGPLDYDQRHVLSISHIWELPFGRHGNSLVGTLLGGWQLNGIFTWSSGTPLTVTADPLLCACPGNTVLANMVPGSSAILNNGTSYLNPAAFTSPTTGSFGTSGRGSVYAPGYRNYDMSLFKNFHVMDRFNLQLRGEAYNLTNTPRFASPVTNINSPDFGQQVSTINGAFGRQVDVGVRLRF